VTSAGAWVAAQRTKRSRPGQKQQTPAYVCERQQSERQARSPAPSSSRPRRPAACVTAAAAPCGAARPPAACSSPNSAASMRPRPRTSAMGYFCAALRERRMRTGG
jgi:hypothetical protein